MVLQILKADRMNTQQQDGIHRRGIPRIIAKLRRKSKPTTVKNSQATAVHERIYLLIVKMTWMKELVVPHTTTVEE